MSIRSVAIGVIIELRKDNFCGVMGIEARMSWLEVCMGGERWFREFVWGTLRKQVVHDQDFLRLD